MTGSLRAFYLTFCLVIGSLVWMLAYGMALQFLYRDGRVLQTMVTTNPFAPFQQFKAALSRRRLCLSVPYGRRWRRRRRKAARSMRG